MASSSPDRPNILYMMTDQQKASASSVNGNRHVPTPFMDAMAAQGVTFLDTYSAAPICTPSRTTVMTGVHPLVHQVTCHQNRAPYNVRQLPEILQDDGYYTAVVGHYEQDRNLTRGWYEQVSREESGGPLGDALRRYYAHGSRDHGWSSGANGNRPEEGHAYAMTARAIEMLDGIEAYDQPFFFHVPYNEPHPPYFVPPPYDSLVDPDSLPVPEQGGEERPDWQAAAREQLRSNDATDADLRKVVARYYGMIAYADSQMQRLYDEMARRGLLKNTWMIFSSDHGDYTGEKGLFMKSESLYECLLHIPLVIVPPEGADWPRGQRIPGFVDQADLFPTILGMAGAPVPEYAQGHDLLPWVRGGAAQPLREVAFAQVGNYKGTLGTTMPNGIAEAGRHRSLLQGGRTTDFSYVRDPDYGDEAYDLRSDPKELVNLLRPGAPSEPQEVTELRSRVDEWEQECLRLRDELQVIPGGQLSKIPAT